MADFQQNGVITTLHRLGQPDLPRLEQEIVSFAAARPVALILPCLGSDLAGPGMPRLLEELAGAAYVNEIVLSLGRAGRKDLTLAKRLLQALPQPAHVLNNEGRRLHKLLQELADRGLAVGQEGKGRAVWLALGLVLARGQSWVAAVQDADIIDYDRRILSRLVYPVVHPDLGFEFSKGYYARVTHKLYGRVTRLFVGPLLLALGDLLGPLPYLRFLGAFRYPLAGEFALTLDLARLLCLPGDWGLEVGVLGEVAERASRQRVCQVDLADSYEHKHQSLSHEDPQKGLARMCLDIGHTLLASLAAQGADLSLGLLRALEYAYRRRAGQNLDSYAAEAAINGLVFDRQEEGLAVETFARALVRAVEQFIDNTHSSDLINSWSQVSSLAADFLPRLLSAVEEDSQ